MTEHPPGAWRDPIELESVPVLRCHARDLTDRIHHNNLAGHFIAKDVKVNPFSGACGRPRPGCEGMPVGVATDKLGPTGQIRLASPDVEGKDRVLGRAYQAQPPQLTQLLEIRRS